MSSALARSSGEDESLGYETSSGGSDTERSIRFSTSRYSHLWLLRLYLSRSRPTMGRRQGPWPRVRDGRLAILYQRPDLPRRVRGAAVNRSATKTGVLCVVPRGRHDVGDDI